MRLVSVVTRTRCVRAARPRISWIRSSICPAVGRTRISGSISPVGRMICSATWPRGPLQLVGARRGRDVEHLVHAALELGEGQRTVVQGRGQPEAVLHQRLLARAVAAVHAADLRQCLVGLVDDDQGVLGQVIHQGRGRLPRLAAGEVPGVILDPLAGADLAHHLQIEEGTLAQALRLEEFVGGLKLLPVAPPAPPRWRRRRAPDGPGV